MLSFEPTSLRRLRSLLHCCSLCAFLALGGLSCGQRGPLYLPEPDPATAGPAEANPPADASPGEQPATDAEAPSTEQDEEYDEETP